LSLDAGVFIFEQRFEHPFRVVHEMFPALVGDEQWVDDLHLDWHAVYQEYQLNVYVLERLVEALFEPAVLDLGDLDASAQALGLVLVLGLGLDLGLGLVAEQEGEQARGAPGSHDDGQPQNVFDLVVRLWTAAYLFFDARQELDGRETYELRLFAVDVLVVHIALGLGGLGHESFLHGGVLGALHVPLVVQPWVCIAA